MLTADHRRLGRRQVDARQRHPVPGAGAQAPRERPGGSAGTSGIHGARAARQGDRHRPAPDRAHAAQQPGHLHQGLRRDPQLLRRSCRRRGSTATSPGRFSFNVKGGRCEACEGDGVRKIEMHFLARRLRALRGVPGEALQRGHARGALQGPLDRRRARAHGAPRRSSSSPPSEDRRRRCRAAPARRPRLPAPRASPRPPSRAARRSASSSPASSRSAPRAARSTSSTSPPPASTSTTCASCSRSS